jgi:hypothetical protein
LGRIGRDNILDSNPLCSCNSFHGSLHRSKPAPAKPVSPLSVPFLEALINGKHAGTRAKVTSGMLAESSEKGGAVLQARTDTGRPLWVGHKKQNISENHFFPCCLSDAYTFAFACCLVLGFPLDTILRCPCHELVSRSGLWRTVSLDQVKACTSVKVIAEVPAPVTPMFRAVYARQSIGSPLLRNARRLLAFAHSRPCARLESCRVLRAHTKR